MKSPNKNKWLNGCIILFFISEKFNRKESVLDGHKFKTHFSLINVSLPIILRMRCYNHCNKCINNIKYANKKNPLKLLGVCIKCHEFKFLFILSC